MWYQERVEKTLIYSLTKNALGRFVLTSLLMLGLFLHAMVPTGFMPSADNGKIAMVICSGMGEKTVMVDSNDLSPTDDQGSPSGHDTVSACPYFLAQYAANYPDQVMVKEPVTSSITDWLLHDPQFVAGSYLSLPQARGPPSLFV